MKKITFILLAITAILFASCVKEKFSEEINSTAPKTDGEYITFTASIDLGPQTKAAIAAGENGMDIKWSEGDYIGVATDNSAVIVAYPVEDISESGTSCTVKVLAVENAQAYYAIFRGSNSDIAADDFTGITFDTSTKTFSGLNVGNEQVSEGLFSSHLYKSNGFPLTMAAKSSGTSLVMKPCLALVKVQIAKESVFQDEAHSADADKFVVTENYASQFNGTIHTHTYSALRGFDFYQKGAETLYCSGDFTVQFDNSGNLIVAPAGNNKEYRRRSNDKTKLAAETPYYMCVIPGGSVSSLELGFYGFTYDGETLNNGWDHIYTMRLAKTGMALNPGDFYDLGTLNPVGRTRAKDHAADEAADEEAAFTPAIDIDGSFSDWDDVSHIISANNSGLEEWRYTTDERNLYFLYKIDASKITTDDSSYNWSPYLYVGLDTDGNASNGGSAGGGIGAGMEVELLMYPWRGDAPGTPQCVIGNEDNGHIKLYSGSAWTTLSEKLKIGGKIENGYCFIEVRVPLASIGNPSGPISVNHSFRWSPTGSVQIMPEIGTITATDQTVDVGQNVSIGATTNSTATISYVSNDPSVATVDSDGVITGVAAGSTTITLNIAAVSGEYTAATKTINVTVTTPYVPAITIDGDLSDWNSITASYDNSDNSRIREWRFKSDSQKVYFYLKLRKNRVDGSKNLYIGIDKDNDDSTGSSYGDITGCEAYILAIPFTNSGEGTTPTPVEGLDSASKVYSSGIGTNNSVVYTWDYDDDTNNPLSSSSSNIWIEISAPRDLLGLPTAGNTITVGCSYGWGTTDKVSVTLE